jgi:hypothetical protein
VGAALGRGVGTVALSTLSANHFGNMHQAEATGVTGAPAEFWALASYAVCAKGVDVAYVDRSVSIGGSALSHTASAACPTGKKALSLGVWIALSGRRGG